jgi:6-phosphofructokinase 2
MREGVASGLSGRRIGYPNGMVRAVPSVVTVTLNPALDLTVEVEELVAYRKLRGRLLAVDPGGGGVNVARVLRRFDPPVLAVAPLGAPPGRRFSQSLSARG